MLNSNSDRNENSAKTREDKILGKILGNLVILGKKKIFQYNLHKKYYQD